MRAFSIEDCVKAAQKRKGICLDYIYKNIHSKLKWSCKDGHIWESSFNNIKKGSWCPRCAGNNRKSLKDCYNLANCKNGKFLSKKYINVDTKYLWECNEGHQWKNTYYQIKSGSWCKVCSNINMYTLNDCHKIAQKKNGKCLAKKFINTKTKMLWQCNKGHSWKTTLEKINLGRWCHTCGGSEKLTLNDCYKIATTNGGKCLSKKYINHKSHLLWACNKGHRWKASLNSIRNMKTWCPKCNTSKSQKFIFDIAKSKYKNTKYNFRGFDWLKLNKNLELDIYIPEIKLAIEYDGIQHFEPTRFGGISLKKANQNLLSQQERDEFKDKKIKESNDILYLIRFNYKERLTREYIFSKINEVVAK